LYIGTDSFAGLSILALRSFFKALKRKCKNGSIKGINVEIGREEEWI